MPESKAVGIVIAGGRGRRMWPFATVRPKAALPVCNRPLIQLLTESLLRAGVAHVIVVVDEQGVPCAPP